MQHNILFSKTTIICDHDSSINAQGFTALRSLLCNKHNDHAPNAPQNKASLPVLSHFVVTNLPPPTEKT
jgi:hypothetical protein